MYKIKLIFTFCSFLFVWTAKCQLPKTLSFDFGINTICSSFGTLDIGGSSPKLTDKKWDWNPDNWISFYGNISYIYPFRDNIIIEPNISFTRDIVPKYLYDKFSSNFSHYNSLIIPVIFSYKTNNIEYSTQQYLNSLEEFNNRFKNPSAYDYAKYAPQKPYINFSFGIGPYFGSSIFNNKINSELRDSFGFKSFDMGFCADSKIILENTIYLSTRFIYGIFDKFTSEYSSDDLHFYNRKFIFSLGFIISNDK